MVDERLAHGGAAGLHLRAVALQRGKALLLLDQRGLIHVDDRVCEYIPEFARHGKHRITIEHVLSHRAGVPTIPREALDLANIDDHELITRIMCDARPRTRPGAKTDAAPWTRSTCSTAALSASRMSERMRFCEAVRRKVGAKRRAISRRAVMSR